MALLQSTMAADNTNSGSSFVFQRFIYLVTPILCVLVVYHYLKGKKYSSVCKLPSPPGLPIIGHLHLLTHILPKSFQKLARRYGPLMEIHIGSTSFVIVSNATIAKEIFKTHDLHFASKFEFGPTEYNIYQGSGFITVPYGPYWLFMKKLCVKRLFADPQFGRFNDVREEEMRNLLKMLMELSKQGKACDLGVNLTTMTNNLICRVTFSKRFSIDVGKEMRKVIVEIMVLAGKLGVNEVFGVLKKMDLFGNGRKLREALMRYDGLIEEIMKGYEEEHENGCNRGGDIMDVLLEVYNHNDQVKVTRDNIKFFILEVFMASIDTTSASIQWSMAELMNHPRILKKLREEILSVVGSKRLVKESDITNLPYLQAIIKESLRLHDPTPLIMRECIKDCKVNGFQVKAKSKTLINAYAIMRDPDSWENPDEFIPERFMKKAEEMKDSDYGYVPFGGGRRGCVGVRHANLVMQATVAALIQCFEWKTVSGQNVDVDVGVGYSGAMALPLLCYPTMYLHPFYV